LFFLSIVFTGGYTSSAAAGAKEAKFITSNGKWFVTNVTGKGPAFNGTMHFDGMGTLRIFYQSHPFRGKYRVSGGTICMQVFRLWGKREYCGPGYKRGNTYFWGGLRLLKR
jgi:hypothetical protein